MELEPIFKATLFELVEDWLAEAEQSEDPEWMKERARRVTLMIANGHLAEEPATQP